MCCFVSRSAPPTQSGIPEGTDVFDDIDTLFQGLTQELNQMLTLNGWMHWQFIVWSKFLHSKWAEGRVPHGSRRGWGARAPGGQKHKGRSNTVGLLICCGCGFLLRPWDSKILGFLIHYTWCQGLMLMGCFQKILSMLDVFDPFLSLKSSFNEGSAHCLPFLLLFSFYIFSKTV